MATTRGAATPRAPAHGAPGAGVPVAHRREPSALVRRTGCRRDHHSRHPRGAEARLEPEADRRWPANKRRAMPAVSHEAASFAEPPHYGTKIGLVLTYSEVLAAFCAGATVEAQKNSPRAGRGRPREHWRLR